ncbi:MAG: hypothetical protein K2L86_13275 [Lachnospiraceae bacterium]|nr:hypothetical protein [Lachnospiraceae bacterium]
MNILKKYLAVTMTIVSVLSLSIVSFTKTKTTDIAESVVFDEQEYTSISNAKGSEKRTIIYDSSDTVIYDSAIPTLRNDAQLNEILNLK